MNITVPWIQGHLFSQSMKSHGPAKTQHFPHSWDLRQRACGFGHSKKVIFMGNVGNCSGFWKFIDVTEIGYVYIYVYMCVKNTEHVKKKKIFHHLCLLLVENKSTHIPYYSARWNETCLPKERQLWMVQYNWVSPSWSLSCLLPPSTS